LLAARLLSAAENAGGMGVPEAFMLRRAKCRVFTFPQIPFGELKYLPQ